MNEGTMTEVDERIDRVSSEAHRNTQDIIGLKRRIELLGEEIETMRKRLAGDVSTERGAEKDFFEQRGFDPVKAMQALEALNQEKLPDVSQGTAAVLREIEAERAKQEEKGYDAMHDDQHGDESLALAAACLATPTELLRHTEHENPSGFTEQTFDDPWPWTDWDGRGKYERRQELVIAAALIVAEIERLDRGGANG